MREKKGGRLPSGSNMRGMSKYFSATSKAKFKFSSGLSWKVSMESRVRSAGKRQDERSYLGELVVVDQIGTVTVNQGTEGKAVFEA